MNQSQVPRAATTVNPNRLTQVYWLLLATCVLAGLALVACLLTYSEIRVSLDERSKTGDQIKKTAVQSKRLNVAQKDLLQTINDCLVPQGKCATRGRANSQNVSTAIVFCTKNLPDGADKDEVTNCIVKVLRGDERK